MGHPFRNLPPPAMRALASALRAGVLRPPFGDGGLSELAPSLLVPAVAKALQALADQGMAPAHIAVMLDLLAEERAAQQRIADRLELVFSPPELDGIDARDTSVVVADLFRKATGRVLIASYVLDSGGKAAVLFGELATRMDADPNLTVQLCVNIPRKHLDETPAGALVGAFARNFRDAIWPGKRLPDIFYDPRSLETDFHQRAALHAKVIVVDERWTLLTSANFTEAAQDRNIEAGVLVEDEATAKRVRQQFEAWMETGRLVRVFGDVSL